MYSNFGGGGLQDQKSTSLFSQMPFRVVIGEWPALSLGDSLPTRLCLALRLSGDLDKRVWAARGRPVNTKRAAVMAGRSQHKHGHVLKQLWTELAEVFLFPWTSQFISRHFRMLFPSEVVFQRNKVSFEPLNALGWKLHKTDANVLYPYSDFGRCESEEFKLWLQGCRGHLVIGWTIAASAGVY